MRAVVNWKEIKEVPEPKISKRDVFIEVYACGICGSDVHSKDNFRGKVIPGHEFSGIIAKVGRDVKNWKPGDKVVVNPQIYCRKCKHCKAGDTNLCNDGGVIGFQRNGGFAEKVAVPDYTLNPLPEGMLFEIGALADPVAVDLHALDLVDLSHIKTIVVFGLGGIGFPIANILHKKGYEIYGIDIVRKKLEIAERCGLCVVNAREENIFEVFKNKEIDLCVVAVGEKSSVFNQALRIVKKKGVLLSISQWLTFEMDYKPFGFKELKLQGVFGHTPKNFRKAIQLLSKEPWAQEMITRRYNLVEFNEAISMASSGQELKIMVNCHQIN